MNKYLNALLAVLAALGGLAIRYLGGLDQLLMALLALIVVDYLTGITKAIATKTLSSNIGFKGICKKVLIRCPMYLKASQAGPYPCGKW